MKRLFLAGILIAGFVSAQAQFSIVLRPQIGINSSSFRDVIQINLRRGVGFQLGADAQFGSRFYGQPGLTYEFLNNEFSDQSGDERITQGRLRITALGGYRLLSPDAGNALNIRLFTGPNFSFVLRKPDEDVVESSNWTNFAWGWNVGGGIDLAFLFVDIGYEFGLSEIIKNLEESPQNNLFYANAGVRIRLL